MENNPDKSEKSVGERVFGNLPSAAHFWWGPKASAVFAALEYLRDPRPRQKGVHARREEWIRMIQRHRLWVLKMRKQKVFDERKVAAMLRCPLPIGKSNWESIRYCHDFRFCPWCRVRKHTLDLYKRLHAWAFFEGNLPQSPQIWIARKSEVIPVDVKGQTPYSVTVKHLRKLRQSTRRGRYMPMVNAPGACLYQSFFIRSRGLRIRARCTQTILMVSSNKSLREAKDSGYRLYSTVNWTSRTKHKEVRERLAWFAGQVTKIPKAWSFEEASKTFSQTQSQTEIMTFPVCLKSRRRDFVHRVFLPRPFSTFAVFRWCRYLIWPQKIAA